MIQNKTELLEKKKSVEDIILAIRKSTGDVINDILPKFLRDVGFHVFALTEKTLIIIFGPSDIIDKQIMIEHGFETPDERLFRMAVKNPAFYAHINMLEDTDAMIYYQALTDVLTDKIFKQRLRETLLSFDLRMYTLKKDIEEIDKQLKNDEAE